MTDRVRCALDLPAEPLTIRAFTDRLARHLDLGSAYPFPTVIDPEGDALELLWCADGRTGAGEPIRIIVGPKAVEIVLSPRESPHFVRWLDLLSEAVARCLHS